MSLVVSQRGRKLAEPNPVMAEFGGGALDELVLLIEFALAFVVIGGAASTKAEGGSPPKVSASAAFSA
jgi:hypothetical protein